MLPWLFKNRCILRIQEPTFASESIPAATLSMQTVCSFDKALLNKPKNPIWTKFVDSLKNPAKVSDKKLILLVSSIFMTGIVLAMKL